MSRIISPVYPAFPQTVIVSDPPVTLIGVYADLDRPLTRELKLNVQLSSSDGTSTMALVQLVQIQGDIGREKAILGSKVILLTTTPTDYDIPVTGPDKVVMGRCNLSRLEVHITPICCCVALPMPETLNFTLANHAGLPPHDCTCIATSGTLTRVGTTNVWRNLSISTPCGTTLGLTVSCDANNLWSLTLSGCAESVAGPMAVDCEAFEMETVYLNGGASNCCDPLNSATSFTVIVTA